MEQKKTIMDYDTVSLDDAGNAVVIIDQTLLPGRTELIRLKTAGGDLECHLSAAGPRGSGHRGMCGLWHLSSCKILQGGKL